MLIPATFPLLFRFFLFSCRTHEESKKDFILRIYLFLRWMDQHKIEYPSHLIFNFYVKA